MDQVLAEVGKRLLAPILAALPPGVKRLVLLPSGGLFLLPLHAAPLGDGSERMCDRYQVSYAPSVEVLADCQAKLGLKASEAKAAEPDLYAVINPQGDPNLVFTSVEGAAIAALFAKPQVHKGEAGTTKAVEDGVRRRAYLHFACHGKYDWDDPSQSGLILADGRLTLARLQLPGDAVDMSAARLVTLSACETGLIDVVKGSADEYVGLPAGFLLAGVPCVVSSLWSVPEFPTALLMERFYVNHLRGDPDQDSYTPLPPVEALHRAQIWLRDQVTVREAAKRCKERIEILKSRKELVPLWLSDTWREYARKARDAPDSRPFAHPYYWAAFAVSGAVQTLRGDTHD
jgi:CHAT domain-containing protein